MTEQQANELAERIAAEFPHTMIVAVTSVDTRNAPAHWFVGVKRAETDVRVLILHSELAWQDALTALYVLSAPETGGADVEAYYVQLRKRHPFDEDTAFGRPE